MIRENDITSIKKLPHRLRKNGFTYSQVMVCGEYRIYEQDYNSGIRHNATEFSPTIKCYEIFKVKVRPAEIISGIQYPEREVFPKDEDFGKTAWSMRELDRAIDKLIKLKGHKS
jgi:hypothetical protein